MNKSAKNRARPYHKDGKRIKNIELNRIDIDLFNAQLELLNTLIEYGYENGAMSINERDNLLGLYDALTDYEES